MMPPDSKLRLKKLNKKCNRCPCLFSVSKNSRIIFCDNRPGRLIDHYANKEELVADFLKNNFSFCHLSKKASAPPRRTFAPPDVRLIKIKDYVLPSFRYLMINYSCNNNCLFCYLGSSKKKADPGPKQILNSIDQIKEKSITIFGGEPTLNKNLFKILEHARRRKKKLKITTNGRRLADRAFCKNFLSFNFNQVTVSLHSYLKKD
ncbi:radical SAM protein, partial [Patescibacteria group bacterium]|nr:radical SAM protein [Patescibacteria group bacterium]